MSSFFLLRFQFKFKYEFTIDCCIVKMQISNLESLVVDTGAAACQIVLVLVLYSLFLNIYVCICIDSTGHLHTNEKRFNF